VSFHVGWISPSDAPKGMLFLIIVFWIFVCVSTRPLTACVTVFATYSFRWMGFL
jgi:hypothetical protein